MGTFWEIIHNYQFLAFLIITDIQSLARHVVQFGGNRQVRAYRGQALLCHRRCRCRSRRDFSLYSDEQRGAGCQEYLSPPKLAGNDKKANER